MIMVKIMFNKLRHKFILISMLSLTFVIAVIIMSINIYNYNKVIKSIDNTLDFLIFNNGIFPKDKDDNYHHPADKMSPEAAFETRYFTVIIADDGTIKNVNTDKIARIDADDAIEYTSYLLSVSKQIGFYKNFRFKAKNIGEDNLYIFVDCTKDLSTFHNFLYTSIILSIIGIFAIFILVLIFSKIILKPVNESYNKQNRFITDASHELKTPLTVIEASAEVLEMEIGENEWVETIKSQVDKLSKLTNDLLFLSKMSENRQKTFTDFSISEILETQIKHFESVALSYNKKISYKIPNNITFHGDINSISQLFSILIDNALKYSLDNSQINISLFKNDKNIKIIFYNECESIETGDLNILFDRFYRSDNSRNSSSGGHGIGLSIAKSIVINNNGKINAKSTDGKSITITIIF